MSSSSDLLLSPLDLDLEDYLDLEWREEDFDLEREFFGELLDQDGLLN